MIVRLFIYLFTYSFIYLFANLLLYFFTSLFTIIFLVVLQLEEMRMRMKQKEMMIKDVYTHNHITLQYYPDGSQVIVMIMIIQVMMLKLIHYI